MPLSGRCDLPICALIRVGFAAGCGPDSGEESGPDPDLVVWRIRHSRG